MSDVGSFIKHKASMKDITRLLRLLYQDSQIIEAKFIYIVFVYMVFFVAFVGKTVGTAKMFLRLIFSHHEHVREDRLLLNLSYYSDELIMA